MSQYKNSEEKTTEKFQPIRSYLILVFFIFLTCSVTYFLYLQVQEFFHDRLQERLLAIASTASIHFEPSVLDKINGPESVGTPVYEDIVTELNRVRINNKNLRFIYILRRTEDPNIFSFVADADSLDPYANVDLNLDSVIDEGDALNVPGEPYDVSEFPILREHGFVVPTVDEELAIDQWGTFLSASAPIKNVEGFADELIGIDVEVSDYVRITNLAFIPFALFVAFLLIVLTSQTTLLVKMWGSRVLFLKELDRQKDELLSIVSHQLAQPITSLKWYIEMFLDGDLGKLNGEQEQQLTTMKSQAANLTDLVSMILDVSRIQLGRMKVNKLELNLNQFFDEIIEGIKAKATEKGLMLQIFIPKDLPLVLLDKRLMRITFENLLTNAVKYSKQNGEVKIEVKVSKGTLNYLVKDSGCGIPKSEQEKVFQKLYRASNVQDIEGNGFGLFAAKGAVEAQGGKIWFESEQNQGTTFFVEIPLDIPNK